MGNQKLKWTAEEEEALLAGVAKHGPGKWNDILKDREFADQLSNRSNIDLKERHEVPPNLRRIRSRLAAREKLQNLYKMNDNYMGTRAMPSQRPKEDKWRNLSVAPGIQGSKDKIRTPKMKAAVARMAAFSFNASHDLRYDGMIFEALSALANTNGSDVGAIVNFIEQRHEVPPNIRRILSPRLMRLAAQGKLVMVSHLKSLQNLYKMNDNSMGTIAMPSPRPKEVNVKLWQTNNQGYGRMVKIADEADTIMEIVKEMQKTSLWVL